MSKVVESALAECADHIMRGIQTNACSHVVITEFMANFRNQFTVVITRGKPDLPTEHQEEVWSHDGKRITALARAIGALADFYAATNVTIPEVPPHVIDKNLWDAYTIIKERCTIRLERVRRVREARTVDMEIEVFMKYCI